MSAQAAEWNVTGHNITFWLKHAKGADRVANITTIVVAALGAIALVSATLALLAHQGVPLGAINAIADAIPATVVYVALGASAIALALDVPLMILLVRGYLGQTLSADQVRTEKLQETYTTAGLALPAPGQHTEVIFDADKGPYCILQCDMKGKLSWIAFTSQQACSAHLSRIGGKLPPMTPEEQVASKPLVEVEINPTNVGTNNKRTIDWLAVHLPPSKYCVLELFNHDKFKMIPTLVIKDNTRLHYFQTEDIRGIVTVFATEYNNYSEYKLNPLEGQNHLHEAWLRLPTTYSNKKVFYLTYYSYSPEPITLAFDSESERTAKIRELGLK